jgi:hypothetical protein
MYRKSFERRYWLLYRKGEYYIKEGYKSNLITSLLLSQSKVITSIKTANKDLATKHLIAAAWEHFQHIRRWK